MNPSFDFKLSTFPELLAGSTNSNEESSFKEEFSKILHLPEPLSSTPLGNKIIQENRVEDLTLQMHCAFVGYEFPEPVKLSLQQLLVS